MELDFKRISKAVEDKVDAVGVADEVVIEAIVALLPREFPQGYIGHTWNGNDRNPPGFWLELYQAGLSVGRRFPW